MQFMRREDFDGIESGIRQQQFFRLAEHVGDESSDAYRRYLLPVHSLANSRTMGLLQIGDQYKSEGMPCQIYNNW